MLFASGRELISLTFIDLRHISSEAVKLCIVIEMYSKTAFIGGLSN